MKQTDTALDNGGDASARMAKSPRRSKWLLRIWAGLALVWVAGAGAASAPPVQGAITRVLAPPVITAPPPPRYDNGVRLPPPDSPRVAAARIIARQAAIVVAPPLLLLWFGWDLWFAVSGFLEMRAKRRARG